MPAASGLAADSQCCADGGHNDAGQSDPLSHVELFSEENNARQGRKDGFHAHQDAESLRGELLEGDDLAKAALVEEVR